MLNASTPGRRKFRNWLAVHAHHRAGAGFHDKLPTRGRHEWLSDAMSELDDNCSAEQSGSFCADRDIDW